MGGCCASLSDGTETTRMMDSSHSPSEIPLPPIVQKGKPAAHQWVRFKDDLSQSIFWHNAATGETLSDENFPPKKPVNKESYRPPSPPPAESTSSQPYRPPSPPPLDSDEELQDEEDDADDAVQDQHDYTDSAAQAAFIHLKLRLSNEIATNLSLGGEQGGPQYPNSVLKSLFSSAQLPCDMLVLFSSPSCHLLSYLVLSCINLCILRKSTALQRCVGVYKIKSQLQPPQDWPPVLG